MNIDKIVKYYIINIMNKKILIFDVIIMAVIISFSIILVQTGSLKHTRYDYYLFALFKFPYFGYYLFVMYLYTFLKSILGMIFLINKLLKKIKFLYSKKYLLFLFPSIILTISYIYFIFSAIFRTINSKWYRGIDDILMFISIPISKGFNVWFPSMNINIILTTIIIIGIFMWLIYWTFYETGIRKIYLIILNIFTPISMVLLYFEIFLFYVEYGK
jgi:hypothetical protein